MVGLQGTATRDSNLTRQFVTTSLNCSLPQVCINEMDYVREKLIEFYNLIKGSSFGTVGLFCSVS